MDNKKAFASIPWYYLYPIIGGRRSRSALRCNHAPGPIESIFLLLLLAGNMPVLQAAVTLKYVANYANSFASGTGPTAVLACTDLAANMTAMGFPRTFYSIIASPSEVTEPCSDDFWYVNYPACELASSAAPPGPFGSCTDHAWVYSVVADEPECSIHLSGPGGTNGALADVEPGKVVSGLRAKVTCDGVPSDKVVTLSVEAEANTGGHNHHDSARPPGTLKPASGSNPLTFSFTAPAPAGDHTITAQCFDGSCGTDTGKVWVGIKGLVSLYETQLYKLVGSDDVHPNNHYLTMSATGSVVWLAELYRAGFPNDPALRLNDASLERGGLFDIKHDRRTQWWTPPHKTHRRGTDIDVRANEFVHADAMPHRNYFDFEEIAIDVGCKAGMHSEFTTNQHYHVTCG